MKMPFFCFVCMLRFCLAAEEIEPSPITRTAAFPHAKAKLTETEAAGLQGPFAEALRRMFEMGLPDPATLPYRSIRIPVGDCWEGDRGCILTEGWVLPKEEGQQERFAITWDGLIYPIAGEPEAADLAASVAKIRKEGEALPDLVAALYLTRLGFSEIATELLNWPGELPPEGFLAEAAQGWAWDIYDRAICAHMRGDANLALASLDELVRIRPQVIEILKRAGAEDPLSWARQPEILQEECRRRVKTGTLGSFDAQTFVELKPDVGVLIAAFDRISVRQLGQPGYVDLSESPIVKAVAGKGEEAVEPLLECLAKDTRLTQSVEFWRDFSQDRRVPGVHEAALAALGEILQQDFSGRASGDDHIKLTMEQRAKLAESIRRKWQEHRKTKEQEALKNPGPEK